MSKNLCLLFVMLFSFVTTSFAAGKFTLVIDAGHGGHDAGAIGAMSKEKNINLSVALAFGRYVEENCSDVKVIYTRKTDVFIPLHNRANIANKAGADLFISVHTNALPAGRIARGFEVYTLGMHRAKDNLDVAMRENSVISMESGYRQTYQGFDPRSSESYIMFEFIQSANMQKSVDLARMIDRSVCSKAGRPDKGVHQAGFLVLRETSMPSCLIELGFITTPDEEAFLNSDNGVDMMARGIYSAFVEYKKKYHGKTAVVEKPSRHERHSSVSRKNDGKAKVTAQTKKEVETWSNVKETHKSSDKPSANVVYPQTASKPVATTPKRVETPQKSVITTAKRVETPKKTVTEPAKRIESAPKTNAVLPKTVEPTPKSVSTPTKPAVTAANAAVATPKPEAVAPKTNAVKIEEKTATTAPVKTTAETATKTDNVAPTPVAKAEEKPIVAQKETIKPKIEPVVTKEEVKSVDTPKPQPTEGLVFKVQIFALKHALPAGSPQFKGHTDVDSIQDKGVGLIKYTIGASEDYEEINQLKNQLRVDFPEAYLVAYKDGQQIALSKAIQEYRLKKKK